MFEKIKEYRKLTREIRAVSQTPCDRDGRHTVKINVSDDSDFLSPFSADATPLIAGETAAFIDQSVKHLRPGAPLNLEIVGGCIDSEERITYEQAIRNYYHAEFIEAVRDIRKNTVQTVIMTAIAAIIFTLAVVLDAHGAESVLLNMIDVVAWVFMWEAADIFVFQRSVLRLKRLRAFGIIRSKITFS